MGHAFETCVLHDLERRGWEVSYVRTKSGFEVNFVARRTGRQTEPVQVVAEVADAGTRERELRALTEAQEAYPKAACRIVALHPEDLGELPRGVTAHAAVDWLLRQEEE